MIPEPVILGPCTLYHADCLDVLTKITGVDVVITDPPYSSQTQSGSRTRNDAVFGGDTLVPFSITWEQLKERFDVARPKRWFIASVDWRHGIRLEENPPTGTIFIRAGVWVKQNSAPQFTGDRPAHAWELVACMHGPEKMRWNGGGKRGVWTSCVEKQNGHPTPKPVVLMEEWIHDFTEAQEIVLDPFMGSGTTGIACIRTGRKFIGIEIDKGYFDIACDRIRRELSQLNLPLNISENSSCKQPELVKI